jgi:hypothetical protein
LEENFLKIKDDVANLQKKVDIWLVDIWLVDIWLVDIW